MEFQGGSVEGTPISRQPCERWGPLHHCQDCQSLMLHCQLKEATPGQGEVPWTRADATRQSPWVKGQGSFWCHLRTCLSDRSPSCLLLGSPREGRGEEQNDRRSLDFLAISMFRLSSSFLITTAKPQRLESSDPDTAFPPDSLPSLLFCFPVAGAPLITKAEEAENDAGVGGTWPCPSASGQGPSKQNHSGQAATMPGIINNRASDTYSLFMVDRKLAHAASPRGSQWPCRARGASILTLYR